jgi:hypothetical protein
MYQAYKQKIQDDNSTNLETNGSANNKKVATSASTKPTNDVKSEQSNSGDKNNEGSIQQKKKKSRE